MPASNWAGEGWTFWQYTSDGTVPGISGRVDLDRYRYKDFTPVQVPWPGMGHVVHPLRMKVSSPGRCCTV